MKIKQRKENIAKTEPITRSDWCQRGKDKALPHDGAIRLQKNQQPHLSLILEFDPKSSIYHKHQPKRGFN